VTGDLDEGPIIEQGVERAGHTADAEKLPPSAVTSKA
jgi:formyltetrahydrofolate hydrolase